MTQEYSKPLLQTVQVIQGNSNIDQWKYILSKENPADDASRGMNFFEKIY